MGFDQGVDWFQGGCAGTNLIGQSVRLALEVEQEKQTLAEERDSLRRTVRGKFGFDNIIATLPLQAAAFSR